MKTDSDGSQTYYVYGLGLIGQEQNGAYHSYHYDLRGSTVALSDVNGVVVSRFSYDPFGKETSGSSFATPFKYNGRDGVQTDSTGLYYMRARYYLPEIKRFVNRDILTGTMVDGQSLNRFAYVSGDPVAFVDPLGLSKENGSVEKNDCQGGLYNIGPFFGSSTNCGEFNNTQVSIGPLGNGISYSYANLSLDTTLGIKSVYDGRKKGFQVGLNANASVDSGKAVEKILDYILPDVLHVNVKLGIGKGAGVSAAAGLVDSNEHFGTFANFDVKAIKGASVEVEVYSDRKILESAGGQWYLAVQNAKTKEGRKLIREFWREVFSNPAR